MGGWREGGRDPAEGGGGARLIGARRGLAPVVSVEVWNSALSASFSFDFRAVSIGVGVVGGSGGSGGLAAPPNPRMTLLFSSGCDIPIATASIPIPPTALLGFMVTYWDGGLPGGGLPPPTMIYLPLSPNLSLSPDFRPPIPCAAFRMKSNTPPAPLRLCFAE